MDERLKKELGLFDIFCIASGTMISSGLFVLPAVIFAKCGPAAIVAYFLASLLILPALLSKAELATAMPKAGGTYFYIDRSLGPFAGTISGFANWFSLSLKNTFALLGIGIILPLIFPYLSNISPKIIAIVFCLLFALLNFISVKFTGRVQIFLVCILFALLFIYIFFGINNINPYRYIPFNPSGWNMVLLASGMVFVSFGGLTKVASIAEEVRNPNRDIPYGMILAFLATSILYVIIVFVTIGIVPPEELKTSLSPLSLGAKISMGSFGFFLIGVAAFIAFFTTANTGILSSSRFPMAMSRDGILPELFRKISYRFKTPYISIFITSILMILAILLLELEALVKTASTFKILLFIFANISLIIMRESKIQTYRPTFKSPFYPYLQIIGIVLPGFIILEMGTLPLSLAIIFIFGSILWYLIYAQKKVERKSALAHVVERVVAKELVQSTLSNELKEIIIERDNIVEDRFDKIIKRCEILDLEPQEKEQFTAEDIFRIIASNLSKRLNIDKEVLFKLFMEREAHSSTVISDGLAIPHIVIEGENRFEIMVVRCKRGIIFPRIPKPVYTLFVLVGSFDERNFHLRALSAIAQIVLDKEFDNNWLKAKNTEDLRNIILLAERKRIGVI
jgi:amino acid transporter/mannitol/fructose-specific phosphotransferase system IIA component (Ntr-type)